MQRTDLFRWGFAIVPLTRLLLVLSVALFLACGGYAYQTSASMGGENSTDDVTYLAQYGTWTNVEPYGSVWQPSVNADWQPFAYGHWVWTDSGWAWVSYEPYGWLVYHYGNWNFQPDIGWFWIEGSEWSPAQVEWLNYDGYCSWAPLPPAGTEWQEPWLEAGLRFWVVVRDQDFDRDNIGHYGIGRPPQPRDMGGENVFHKPLDVHDFEKITGRKLTPISLNHGPMPVYMNPKRPIQHNEIQPGAVQHEQKPPAQMPPDNRPAEAHQGQNQPHETNPVKAQPADNRQGETQPVQLHRMVLPKSEEARVNKYSPQIEREVLVPKNNNNQPSHNASEGKNKK